MRISDWSSDVCSSDLLNFLGAGEQPAGVLGSLAGLDGDAATEIVGLEMLDIVLRLGVADARLDVLLVAGDQCRRAAPCQPARHPSDGSGHAGATPNSTQPRRRLRCRPRSEEHTSELQSLIRISYAVLCLKKKT